jgi:hypothetical protein
MDSIASLPRRMRPEGIYFTQADFQLCKRLRRHRSATDLPSQFLDSFAIEPQSSLRSCAVTRGSLDIVEELLILMQ